MQHRKKRLIWLVGALLGYALLVLTFSLVRGAVASQSAAPIGPAAVFSKPTYSSPIALSQNNALVWVVNPDDDSVSVIRTDTNTIVKKITVGDEPQSVAVDPNNTFAYVANAADNTVTVIRIFNATPGPTFDARVDTTVGVNGALTTGSEPWNVVISPDGARVFVANSGQDTITIINANTRTIIGNVSLNTTVCNDHNGDNVGDPAYHFQPRGLAVTQNNDRLYVTRFLSFVKPGGVQATDTGKEGVVCQFAVNTAGITAATVLSAPAKIALGPQITGFKAAINNVQTDTSAYPNQLQSIVIHGNQAYLPNIAASPSPPLKFNVDTQAFVNVIDNAATGAPVDASAAKFLNLHLGARIPESGKTKLFFANPWAIAFTSANAYVVSAGSDLLVKVNVDTSAGATAGKLSFTGGVSTTKYIDLNDPNNAQTAGANAGKNPLGIVINDAGTTAYVMNYVSRNVSVVNLTSDSVSKVVRTTELPPPDTLEEILQVGKEIFFSSRGHFDRPAGTTVSTDNRLSSEGWQNCASCHFAGLTDGNIWSFNSGPRKSVPLNGTWNPHNPDDQRLLNYSAIFDEVQDFEANVRNVSGPGNKSNGPPPVLDENHGLLIGDDGDINKAPGVVNNFAKPNAGRPQLTVTLPGSATAVPALDALKEWVRFNVRTPNGELTTAELAAGGNNPAGGNGGILQTDIDQGRALFFRAGCQTCHGGGKWTNSTVDFIPPPAAALVAAEAPATSTTVVSISYIADALRDIKSFALGVAGGPNQFGNNIGGVEKSTDNKDALGKDHNGDGKGNGFNPPSLLGIWALQPYYHNGACETLACVLSDPNHRVSSLSAPEQAKVVEFLKSLDANTAPATNLYINKHDIFFDPPAVIAGTTVNVGANISLFGPKEANLAQPMTVTFYDGQPGAAGTVQIGTANLNFSDFNQDFGQATVSVPWNVPAQPGVHFVFVSVDTANLFVEDNERDNSAGRRIRTRPTPPDRTPPTVSNVRINGGAAVTDSSDVTVTFNADDPASTPPQSTSGVDSFCIVRYSYDNVRRRWVEEDCNFAALPLANGDGSFTVAAKLRPRAGTAYAFVWVKDKAGNISRDPGFDVISFIPSPTTDVELDRNDVRIFRITLDQGQSFSFTATPDIGDVDLSVFDGNTRVDVQAHNGTTPETTTFSNAGPGTKLFQIEVRAVVNSRFRITTAQTLAGLLRPSVSAISPSKVVSDTPLVSGPPRRAAIQGAQDVNLPIILH